MISITKILGNKYISLKNKTLIFILPAIVLALLILSVYNFFSLRSSLTANFLESQNQIESNIVNSIDLIDGGYRMLEKYIEIDLEKKLKTFYQYYLKANSNPNRLDLKEIKRKLGGDLEVYIINSEAVIQWSSEDNALNFDFKKMGLGDSINSIRLGKKIAHERVRPNTITGVLGKWIYLPTPDQKYILELGYNSTEVSSIVKELDPVRIAGELKEISQLVSNIRIFDTYGFQFGDFKKGENKPTEEITKRIERTKKEKKYQIVSSNETKKYIYIDLKSKKEAVSDNSKIVEITYNTSLINKSLTNAAITSILIGLLLIGFVIISVIKLSEILTRPIQDLEQAAREIAEGDYDKQVTARTKDEIGRLATSFNKMVIEIKNSYDKLEQVTKEKAVTETEMNIARQIQTALLPEKPQVSEYELTAYMQTADAVGGDYYDTIKENGREWFLIGDVSGHGVPAGLVMMMVQTSIHTVIFSNPDIEPSKLLESVNLVISNNIAMMKMNKYMTITLFLKDKDGKIHYSGMHQDLVIYRSKTKTVETVETNGNWLGFAKIQNIFPTDQLILEKGDVLFLYTDGITEAIDKDENPFDLSGLVNFLEISGDQPVDNIKSNFLDSFKEYKSEDDITFMILKRTKTQV